MSSVNWWITNSFSGSRWRSMSWASQADVALTSRGDDLPDDLARHLAFGDPPLRVEREPDVGLLRATSRAASSR